MSTLERWEALEAKLRGETFGSVSKAEVGGKRSWTHVETVDALAPSFCKASARTCDQSLSFDWEIHLKKKKDGISGRLEAFEKKDELTGPRWTATRLRSFRPFRPRS